MDVKVNNHKSWLGLSTHEASSDVTRLDGSGLWSLPNVHKASSECFLWSRTVLLVRLLEANPCTGTRASLQPHLAVERGSETDKDQESGTAGSMWVTAFPRTCCVHTGFPRWRSVLFRGQQREGSVCLSVTVMCHEAVLWGRPSSRV